MKRLVIADAARDDLTSIAGYTEERWGAARKHRYMEAIRRRIAALRRRPSLGRAREDLGSYCRSLISGQHVLLYRETEGQIELLRVLHQSMDLQARLVKS